MNSELIIIGASGHGKVIADIAKLTGYNTIEFLDDNKQIISCGEYRVLGTVEEFIRYKDYDFIVAIGNAAIREKIQNMIINSGCKIVTLVHPNATIACDTKIGTGTVVMAGAVINSGSTIGSGVIVNTCSSVDHDCKIEDFAHISVGAHVAGTVYVAPKTWIGAGATVINNINILKTCTIGAGTVVVSDIEQQDIYVGVPAVLMKQ